MTTGGITVLLVLPSFLGYRLRRVLQLSRGFRLEKGIRYDMAVCTTRIPPAYVGFFSSALLIFSGVEL